MNLYNLDYIPTHHTVPVLFRGSPGPAIHAHEQQKPQRDPDTAAERERGRFVKTQNVRVSGAGAQDVRAEDKARGACRVADIRP
jgi:hypothetical protein